MKEIRCIGLMTGTSLDGIDVVDVTFSIRNDKYSFQMNHFKCFKYDKVIKNELLYSKKMSRKKIKELNKKYGGYLGEIITKFIKRFKIDKSKISFIASHGYTVFHQPKNNFTLQIGSGKQIAKKTKIPVIYDFRKKDVKNGGQGAPLVPIGDLFLFNQYDACVNLGGFGNVTILNKKKIKAFDICPVNLPLNKFANIKDLPYDKNGELGRRYDFDKKLFERLNKIKFYNQKPPKSLGTEWLENKFYPKIKVKLKNINTLYHHISKQISSVLNYYQCNKVVVTGGGAFNSFLIELIKQKTESKIILLDKNIIEFKEALIFAFLGVRYVEDKFNCLKSVTGAKKNVKGGKMIFPTYH